MSRMCKNINDSQLKIDDDSQDKKHDSESERKARDDEWEIGKRIKVINMRKLSSWLISDWKHKRKHMQLSELSFEPVKSGLFYSIRLGGVWVAADYWLKHLGVDQETRVMRLEFLESDFKKYIFPFTNFQGHTIAFNEQENSINLSQEEKANYNLTNSMDLTRIYTNNPYWAEIENRIY